MLICDYLGLLITSQRLRRFANIVLVGPRRPAVASDPQEQCEPPQVGLGAYVERNVMKRGRERMSSGTQWSRHSVAEWGRGNLSSYNYLGLLAT